VVRYDDRAKTHFLIFCIFPVFYACIYVYVCMYVCMYSIYVCICIYVYSYLYLYVCVYICIYVNSCICMLNVISLWTEMCACNWGRQAGRVAGLQGYRVAW
jgi:hypothetical protein